MSKFIIHFDDLTDSRRANERVSLLGRLCSISPPHPSAHVLDHFTPFNKELYDPYIMYFTLAPPPSTWLSGCKNYAPTVPEQMKFVKETMNNIFHKQNIYLDIYYTIEFNSNLDFIHLHGCCINKKNLNQLSIFKRLLREKFYIPHTNRIALKFYPQSQYKTQQSQLNYHLKSLDYHNKPKSKPEQSYYKIVNKTNAERIEKIVSDGNGKR